MFPIQGKYLRQKTDVRFWILDFGYSAVTFYTSSPKPISKIQNPKSKIGSIEFSMAVRLYAQ